MHRFVIGAVAIPCSNRRRTRRLCVGSLTKGTGSARTMDIKKITRNPLFYVLMIGFLLVVGFSLISSLGGAKQISTQEGLKLLDGGTVTEVTNTDGDQRVDMKLSEAVRGRDRRAVLLRAGARRRGRRGGRRRRSRARASTTPSRARRGSTASSRSSSRSCCWVCSSGSSCPAPRAAAARSCSSASPARSS